MRTIFRSLAAFAALLLTFNACNHEALPEASSETHNMTFVASAPQTKTSATIDKDAKTVDYLWSEEDANRFTVYEIVGDTYTPATSVTGVGDENEMLLEAHFEGAATSGAKYIAILNKGVKANQSATDTSYDQESDVLISEEVSSENIEGETLELRFKRETSFALMTAKGLEGSYVIGTSITAANEKLLAAEYDVKTKCFAKTGSSTIAVNALSEVEAGQSTIFVSTVPVEDASLTVGVVTSDENGNFHAAYEKSFAEGKTISFSRGDVCSFGIGMNKVEGLTLDLSIDETITATTDEMSWDKTFVSVVAAKGSANTNTNNYYPGTSGQSYTSTRFYKNSTLTFTPKLGLSIKEIVYTATTAGYATALATSTWTNATASASGTIVTIIPTDGTQAVSATIGNTTGAESIRITYGIPVKPTSHSVIIDSNIEHGSVAADPSSDVMPGTEVKLTASSDEGYEFESWKVDGATVANATSATTTFTMPTVDVTVSATFKKAGLVTYMLADMDGFSTSWNTTYAKKTTTFKDGAYVELASANKSTSTITDCPVSKGGDVIFMAPEGKTITELTFTCKQWSTKAQTITLHTSDDGIDYTATSVTSEGFVLTAENLTNVAAVKFTFSNTGNQIGYESITVKYGAAPVPVTKYDITCSNVDGGTISSSAEKAAAGTRITLSATPNLGYEFESWNVTGATVADETSATTTFTMPAANVNVSATFKEKEIEPLKTMDEIFAAATTAGSTATDARISFNNWVVSGVKNNNAYLTDNNGKGLVIYASGHGFEEGNILSGTANCKVQLYNGAAELTNLTSTTTGISVVKGGVATPQTISIADLSGVNTGAVLTFEELTYNGSDFTDGANTIKPYNTFSTLPTLVSGKKYSVTGVYIQYNDTKEIAPRTTEDIVEKVAPKYAVTVAQDIANGTVTVDYPQATEGQAVTITATPATGYKVKSVSAQTASGKLTVTDNKFTMPAEAVTVSAEFEMKAETTNEYSFTIQTSDFNTTSYAANNGSHDFTATCTTDASKTMTVACTSNQVMQSSSVMQWKKSEGYIYNTTDLGTIKSVTVNSTAGSFTTYYGTSEHPASGTTVGNGFFTVKVGSATGQASSIVVVFEK